MRLLPLLFPALGAAAGTRAIEVEIDARTSITSDCDDLDSSCGSWAEAGECSNNPGFMLPSCPVACNVCPEKGMAAVHAEGTCTNGHDQCSHWASVGECAANPSYMLTSCAKACRACHLLDPDVRCRPMPGRVAAAEPGTVNETFARAVADFPQLEPRVLSSDPWVISIRVLAVHSSSFAVISVLSLAHTRDLLSA